MFWISFQRCLRLAQFCMIWEIFLVLLLFDTPLLITKSVSQQKKTIVLSHKAMTTLAKVIKIRSLLRDFSQQELAKFVKKLTHPNLTVLGFSLLHNCKYFVSGQTSNTINDDLGRINKTAASIILARKEERAQSNVTKIALGRLPKAIIGHMASYLEQQAYFNFGTTNRAVYLGCNDPNQLQSLDLETVFAFPLYICIFTHVLKRLRIIRASICRISNH